MKSELLIGFSIREMWISDKSSWEDRLSDYLLKNIYQKPFSVDSLMWKEIFSAYVSRNDEQTQREDDPSGYSYIPYPDWSVQRRGFYANLHTLVSYVNGFWKDQWQPSCIIAATILSTGDDERYEGDNKTDPQQIDYEWIHLGYDVADNECYSGLFDGILTPKLRNTRHEWASKLNKHHLFTDLDDALSYIPLANERMADHAPFIVYGLYLIQKKSNLRNYL